MNPVDRCARRRRLWQNLLVLLFATALSLVLAEGTTRLFFSGRILLFPRYHTDATYGEYRIRRLRPNSEFWHTSIDGSWEFTINAQGFRANRNFAYEKPEGVLRVVTLGDSQTQGFEVRQGRTYSAVIENYLNRHDVKAEVLNTGVSGFGTAEELIFLENEGVKYNPDFVVLGFYANDLEDNVKSDLFRLDDSRLILNRREHLPGVGILNILNQFSLLRWLSENSYFYSALMNAVWDTTKRRLYSSSTAELRTEYAIAVDRITDYQIQLGAKLIERMYAFCRTRGITLIILDIPQLDGENLKSSVPPTLEHAIIANSDAFLSSESILGPVPGVAELFVPHGQRHISEITHLMLGLAVSKAALLLRETVEHPGPDQPRLLPHQDTHWGSDAPDGSRLAGSRPQA